MISQGNRCKQGLCCLPTHAADPALLHTDVRKYQQQSEVAEMVLGDDAAQLGALLLWSTQWNTSRKVFNLAAPQKLVSKHQRQCEVAEVALGDDAAQLGAPVLQNSRLAGPQVMAEEVPQASATWLPSVSCASCAPNAECC